MLMRTDDESLHSLQSQCRVVPDRLSCHLATYDEFIGDSMTFYPRLSMLLFMNFIGGSGVAIHRFTSRAGATPY